MTPTLRARLRVLAVVALGAFSLSLVPLLIIENCFVPKTSFGFDVDNLTLLVAIQDPRAAKAGLRDGDQLDVARMSYDDRVKVFSDIYWPVGTRVVLSVRNPRFGSRIVDVRAFHDPAPLPPEEFFAYWTHAPIAFLWVLVGAVLVIRRPGVMTWGFYLFCLALHPFPSFGEFLGPPWVTAILIVGFLVIHALGYAGIIVFAARFPRGNVAGVWKYLEFAALPVFLVLLYAYVSDWLPELTGTPSRFDPEPLNEAVVYLVAATVLVALFIKLIRLQGHERATMAWVFAGYAGCNAGFASWYLVLNTGAGTWLHYAVRAFNTVGLASFPLFVAYAVVWHRAFALGFITNRILVYGFFAVTIGMLFGIIDALVSAEVTFRSLGIGLGLAAAFAAGLLLQSQYRRAIRLVDRIFLPQRYATGLQLDRIREAVRSGTRRTDERVASDVADALGLASVAVFGRTSDGGFVRELSSGWSDSSAWHVLPQDDLCRALTRGPGLVRLTDSDARDISFPAAAARPRIAIAVKRHGRVERAILVGSRQSGSALDRDEVRGLAAVFADAAA